MVEGPITLKPGKEKAILNHHHWIFSGAVAQMPSCERGEILAVLSHEGRFLGRAYINPQTNIIGRMITFDERPALQAIEENLMKAWLFRKKLFASTKTNGFRLVNGEGDFLSGLIIDLYHDVAVIQISTAGMERVKSHLLGWLHTHIKPRVIYEKSESNSRKEEGLAPFSGLLFGSDLTPVQIEENGIQFLVDFHKGQKTGFFCDQRRMREQVKELSSGKRVLNCFAYSGGFSLYAMAGGGAHVDSVEISKDALAMLEANRALNGFHGGQLLEEDVFTFLREKELPYDLVILDPPAFAKRQKDVVAACKGYKEINRLALKKMPAQSVLLTCSCSHFVDEELFQKVLFQAAVEAKREVRIVGRHRLSEDHPTNICHPESDYLKSLLLYVC